MATLPAGITQSDVDRYAKLDAGIKALEAEHRMLGELIKTSHIDAGITGKKTLIYENVIVMLNEQRRVDRDTLTETFPFDEYPEFYAPIVDPEKVPADILDTFRTNVVVSLSVRLAE